MLVCLLGRLERHHCTSPTLHFVRETDMTWPSYHAFTQQGNTAIHIASRRNLYYCGDDPVDVLKMLVSLWKRAGLDVSITNKVRLVADIFFQTEHVVPEYQFLPFDAVWGDSFTCCSQWWQCVSVEIPTEGMQRGYFGPRQCKSTITNACIICVKKSKQFRFMQEGETLHSTWQ